MSPPAGFGDAPDTFELIDLATGDLIASHSVDQFSGPPSFSADGRVVVIGANLLGQPVTLYGVAERRFVRTLDDNRLRETSQMVFSADGRVAIAPQGGGRIVVLDATTFEVTGELETAHSVVQVVVSVDGSLIAVLAGGGAPTQLYDVRTGETFGDAVGPAVEAPPGVTIGPAVSNLALSSSGRSLVMFSGETLIRVDLDPDSWLSQACTIAGRNLTQRGVDRPARQRGSVRGDLPAMAGGFVGRTRIVVGPARG